MIIYDYYWHVSRLNEVPSSETGKSLNFLTDTMYAFIRSATSQSVGDECVA